ncbi:MAG: hypothetical protein ACR2LX_12730 [Jatrophihabitans sp.]
MPPRRSAQPGVRNNRPLLIMIAVTVVVVLAAIIAVIVAVNGGSNPNAQGSPDRAGPDRVTYVR